MVAVGYRPILWHVMRYYAHFGHRDFILCLGYKGYLIKEYFANYCLHNSDVTFDMTTNRMQVHQRKAEAWKVTLVVQNTGWLPAYVSKRALERKTVRGVVAEIALPDGATLVTGKVRDEHGQLEGRSNKHTGVSFWPDYHITDDRMKLEWVVRGKAGSTVGLLARHEKAGVVRASVLLS